MPGPTTGVVLTVLAVVLGGDAGAGPADGLHPIDKGLLDGLRPGDRGAVHYVLTVEAEERSIPAGEAVVAAVEARRAWVEVVAERPPRPGYRVAFELPPNRLAPRELLQTIDEHLEGAERERARREVVEEWVLGEDAAVRESVLEALRMSSRPSEESALSSRSSEESALSSRPSEASGETSAPQPTAPPQAEPQGEPAPPPRSLDSGRSATSARDDIGADPADSATSARDDMGADPADSATSARDDIGADPVPPGMLLVPAGTYSIGAPPSEAAFYNQQPRFDTFLEAFWIDATPVRLGRVGEGRAISAQEGGTSSGSTSSGTSSASSPHLERSEPEANEVERSRPTGRRQGPRQQEGGTSTGRDSGRDDSSGSPRRREGGTWLTGLTFDEAAAFCRRLGKRLPTEIEWEAAVTTADTTIGPGDEDGLRLVTPILEWTASWYQPYPGNPVSEREYGERYRVLRGAGPNDLLAPRRRRFMAPEARHPGVGFRCVLDG